MSADTGAADFFLMALQCREQHLGALSATLAGLCGSLQVAEDDVEAFAGLVQPMVTCYLRRTGGLSGADVAAAAGTLAAMAADAVDVCSLQLVASHAGAAAGQSARYHYVVRTDVEAGGEAELERWYDLEHMPMLAAVPGTVRARRLLSLDASPRFYACYDLVSPKVLDSAEWLRVRQTSWSRQVRPTFRNTSRVMSKRLLLFPASVDPV